MNEKPYFCPNCRSNRVKFNRIERTSIRLLKDAMSGDIIEIDGPVTIEEPEPIIECRVCHLAANEQRFIKQAEREPRTPSVTESNYR